MFCKDSNINDKSIFCKEPDTGNLEYKLTLIDINNYKFEKYSTQLLYRIIEGNGYAIYILGITNNGIIIGINKDDMYKTINIFNKICDNVNCIIKLILLCTFNDRNFLIIKVVSNFNVNNIPFNI